MGKRNKADFDEFMVVLEMRAAQMGVAVSSLPRTPQQIYELEQNGLLVDVETGEIVPMDADLLVETYQTQK